MKLKQHYWHEDGATAFPLCDPTVIRSIRQMLDGRVEEIEQAADKCPACLGILAEIKVATAQKEARIATRRAAWEARRPRRA